MGDILHALPAVTALRRAHPEWRIGWVVEPRWQALLKAGSNHPSERRPLAWDPDWDQGTGTREGCGSKMPVVDRLHFAPMREWKRCPLSAATSSGIRSLRRELRQADYNAVLDLQGAIRSAAIARMTGCPRRIGEAKPREWPAQWLFTEKIATRGAHVIEQDVELASAVAGDALSAVDPLLPVDPDAENWCNGWLAANLGAAGQPIALIAPGAGWGAKRWPAERYAKVAEGLAERGMHVAVNAGPGEEQLAEAIVSTGAAVSVVATLPRLIALTRRIALCVGGDTGPLHLACALRRPVVGIYGPTDPDRNGPYGTRARVLRSPVSHLDHSRCSASDPGLLTIAPDEVLRAADELLCEEYTR